MPSARLLDHKSTGDRHQTMYRRRRSRIRKQCLAQRKPLYPRGGMVDIALHELGAVLISVRPSD